jgi:hypothetical protein
VARVVLGLSVPPVHEPVHTGAVTSSLGVTPQRLPGHQARGPEAARQSYALRGCHSALLGETKLALASCPQVVAGGDRWLLTAVRGHLGDTRPMCVGPVLGGVPPSNDLPFFRRPGLPVRGSGPSLAVAGLLGADIALFRELARSTILHTGLFVTHSPSSWGASCPIRRVRCPHRLIWAVRSR